MEHIAPSRAEERTMTQKTVVFGKKSFQRTQILSEGLKIGQICLCVRRTLIYLIKKTVLVKFYVFPKSRSLQGRCSSRAREHMRL